MNEARMVLCECCGSEGRIIVVTGVEIGYGYIEEDRGPCPACKGTGYELVDVQPIEMEDCDEQISRSPE